MQNMLNNLPHFLLGAGLLLMILEIFLGFTTIVLLTLGISALITSALMYMGVLNEALLDGFIAIAVIDTVLTAALWRPLRNMQKESQTTPVKHDFVGLELTLETDASPSTPGTIRYSGVNWEVRASRVIEAGSRVRVTAVDVGVFTVEPI